MAILNNAVLAMAALLLLLCCCCLSVSPSSSSSLSSSLHKHHRRVGALQLSKNNGLEGGEEEEEQEEDEHHHHHRQDHHRHHRGAGQRGEEEEEEEGEGEEEAGMKLNLGKPREVLRTEGGALRLWAMDQINMGVGACELELRENGLLLPAYADVPKIGYITQGCGYIGAVFAEVRGSSASSRHPYVRRVRKGDVVAIPEGTIYWWYNHGNEPHRVLFAADTTSSSSSTPGRAHQFALVGGQRRHFGSLLHGFSHEALGTAWGVDKETIRSLLGSQSEVSIIRTQKTLRFARPPSSSTEEESEEEEEEEEEEFEGESKPESREERREEEESRRRRRSRADEEAGSSTSYGDGASDSDLLPRRRRRSNGGGSMMMRMSRGYGGGAPPFFREIHYPASSGYNQPDFFVEKGGVLDVIDFQKFPALIHVGFSVARISLEKNAMFAPSYIPNAHQLIYITRGSGRIQVSTGDGCSVLDDEVSHGAFVLIPQFFPSVKIAGNQGLEWVDLLTSHRPAISFLAGRNSVYRHIPKQVLASAFNVEQGTLKQLGRDEAIIFPPQSSSSDPSSEFRASGRRSSERSSERREEEEEERRHGRRASKEEEEEEEDDGEDEHHHHHHHRQPREEDEDIVERLEQALLASVL